MKRIYAPYDEQDGQRILVDRLWPRGLKKEDAHIDLWPKVLTPSNELRKWYSHEAQDWDEFQQRYRGEIQQYDAELQHLRHLAQSGKVTLLTASKYEQYNHVIALKAILEESE